MGVTDSSALLAVTARQGKPIDPHQSIDAGKSPKFYRPTRNRLDKSLLVEHVTPPDEVESFRIRSMKKELMHYRNTLDQMVRLKTEMLDRRLAILESCNSRLGENYHQMHQMYLDLLIRTQAYEAQTHLHVLEGELAMLNPAQSIEAGGV